MNILIAPNSFRGSLDAFQVTDAIAGAFWAVNPDFKLIKMPVADGGDFTGEVLLNALGGSWKTVQVENPIGEMISSRFGLTEDGVAIIELADASGTRLMESKDLNPLKTSTFGTGQLIKAALDAECSEIIIGLGGSATVDGGTGLLQALGVAFFDKKGQLLGRGGEILEVIDRIDASKLDPRLKSCKITVPCDVNNYLLGEEGAAKVFGPQKGATPKMVETLEKGMTNFSLKVWETLERDMVNLKHGGAAGGTSAGLWAFLNANLVAGSAFVLDILHFNKALKKVDLVITAEGKLDAQTEGGKAPHEVATRAKKLGKPVIAFAGAVPVDEIGLFDGVYSITNEPMSLKKAMKNAEKLLFGAAFQVAKFYNRLLNQPIKKNKGISGLVFWYLDDFENQEAALKSYFQFLEIQGLKSCLITSKTRGETVNFLEKMGLTAAFFVENGGAFFTPKNYLTQHLPDAAELGDYEYLTFGTSVDLIYGITDKLTKIAGTPMPSIRHLTPEQRLSYFKEDFELADLKSQRQFSELLLKPKQPINPLFISMLQQQGLNLQDVGDFLLVSSTVLPKALATVINWAKETFEECVIYGLGSAKEHEVLLELVEEPFLLKQQKEWQAMYVDNLNLLNADLEKGLSVFAKAITNEKDN